MAAMLERWSFYLRHSFNDLRVNGRRTAFALLCIAAGVSAIVSLQTLGFMIGDTLTGNLQQSNRGDIRLSPSNDMESEGDKLDVAVEKGQLVKQTISFFGSRQADYLLTPRGIDEVRNWLSGRYQTTVQLTYRQPLSHMLSVVFGSGTGASMTVLESGRTVPSVNPIVIEGQVYPFYGRVQSVTGQSLNQLLRGPTDIVVSRQVAARLDVAVGSVVRLSGSDAEFTIRGVVDDKYEVKSFGPDFLNALYGFYYLDVSALTHFDDVTMGARTVYLKLGEPGTDKLQTIKEDLEREFGYFKIKTTEDLRSEYRRFADAVTQMVSLMGLISLLIGCIGIINTMQVIVRRRTLEVAVLKTIGLQANQITVLFLVEAALMGVLGSILGILLGWGVLFLIKGGAETLLATSLAVTIVPTAAINGFVVGVLVTTVFGILPTLSAGRVRPSIVLRPSQDIVPRAGFLRRLLSLVVLIVVLATIAQSMLGSFGMALLVISGAFVAAGFLYVLLYLLSWAIGKLTPSFGIAELRISLRQLVASRGRAAVTMLALVIGVFSLSLITLFSETMTNILEVSLGESAGGNLAITLSSPGELPRVREAIEKQPGLKSYKVMQSYGVQLVGLSEADGTRLSMDDVGERMRKASGGVTFGPDAKRYDPAELLRSTLGAVDASTLADVPQRSMASGRSLAAEDEGQPVVALQYDPSVQLAGIDVGDSLIFHYVDARGEPTGQEFALKVIGIEKESLFGGGFGSRAYALRSAFPADQHPDNATIMVFIDQQSVPALRRELLDIPGIFVLETATLVRLVSTMLDNFTALPLIVAALGLIVGGIVIANSVALSTMERRREIAVMKAIGLQRERVLLMLLVENAIMGSIAGLLGVGIGVAGLLGLSATGGIPIDVIPFGTAFLLMGLCILVALIAALGTAWSASGEKPLSVLRYE